MKMPVGARKGGASYASRMPPPAPSPLAPWGQSIVFSGCQARWNVDSTCGVQAVCPSSDPVSAPGIRRAGSNALAMIGERNWSPVVAQSLPWRAPR
jgi:hypothetical protein